MLKTLKNKRLAIYGDGSIQYLQPFNTQLHSKIIVTLDDKVNFTTDLQLNGSQEKLLARLNFHENLNGSASISIENILLNPSWTANIELDNVNTRIFDSSSPDITGDVVLALEGTKSHMQGEGEIQAVYRSPVSDNQGNSAVIQQQRRINSDIEFELDLSSDEILVELEKLTILVDEGELELTGNYNFTRDKVDLDVSWNKLSWSPQDNEITFNTRGALSVAGVLDDYNFKSDINVSSGKDFPPVLIVSSGSGNREGVSLDDALITTLGGELEAKLSASWEDALHFRLHWQGKNINPGLQWNDWSGDLAVAGDLQMEQVANSWIWTLHQTEIGGRLRQTPVSLSINAESSSAGNILVRANMKYAEAIAEVKGLVGDKLDLNWRVQSDDLSLLDQQLGGLLSSKGKLSGTYEKPNLEAKINASGLRSPWVRSEEITADIKFNLTSDARINADVKMNQVHYQDMSIEELSLEVKGRNSDHQFELAARLPELNLHLKGDGKLKQTRWSAKVNSLLAEHVTYHQWQTSSPFMISYADDAISIDDFCLQQLPTSVCMKGHYINKLGDWEIEAGLKDLSLNILQYKLPETMTLDGVLEADLQIKGKGDKPVSGDARVFIPSGTLNLSVADDVDSLLSLDQSYLNIKIDADNLTAEGQVPEPGHGFKPFNTRFKVSGLSQSSPALENLSIAGELQSGIRDLSLISAIFPYLIEVKGGTDLDLRVSGFLSEPDYDGSFTLKEGGFSSPDLGIEIKNINLEGSRVEDKRYEIKGKMNSGNGHLSAIAKIGQLDKKGPELKVKLEGDKFELINLPELWALVNPQINSKITAEEQLFEGSIFIPAAKIDLAEIAIPSTLSADEIVDSKKKENKTENIKRKVNVKVLLGDSIEVSGMGVSGKLVGELNVLTGKNGILIGDGEIAISDGKYSAYGQKLTIKEGRLIYKKAVLDNPLLSLVAVREIEDLKVGVNVKGYLSAPDISLFSSRSMPQEQILAYIIFGRPLNTLTTGEGSDLLGAAASMGLSNSSFITEKVAARFGLDKLSISGSDAQSASLVVGKYLNPKLYLSYGLGIFDKISTARLRYDLSRRFSVEAERGAETGVDLFYKIDK